MRRLYILVESSVVPIVLTLPPTSIIKWETYKSAVLGVQMRSPKEVVTEFSLGAEVNDDGTEYAVVLFEVVGCICVKAQETIKLLGNGETYDKVAAEDYNAAPVVVTPEEVPQEEACCHLHI